MWLGIFLGQSLSLATSIAEDHGLPVTFDTAGGDAWTFQKIVSGRTAPRECDEVLIQSPGGEARARVQSDNSFVARVSLRSGLNPLDAFCRRAGRQIGRPSAQLWSVRLPDKPRAEVHVQVSGREIVLDGGATRPGPGLPSPIVRYEWQPRDANPAPIRLNPAERNGQRLEIAIPRVNGRYYITMRATDALGRTDETTAAFRVQECNAATVDTQREHPAWADRAVVYGVALPLFEPKAFQAVTNRLDAIAALGASVIWLSPVTAAPPRDFGYAVTDPFAVRTAFGSDAQFRALISAAHARGLRVILDAVTNQLSDQSRYFADSQARGKASPYYDWFARDASGRALHYFDWQNLENLNYGNPEVRTFLTAALTHWLQLYSTDGFRIDAAWGMRQRAPELWPAVRQELERVNPDVWLLGEASARDTYYAHHGFDAAYDWTMTVGQWAWQGIFGAPDAVPDLNALRSALSARKTLPVLHFINDNDTGKRFITLHGLAQTRVAAALLFTLPGIPLIYDGDETGLAFEPYSAHGPLSWEDPYGLVAVYRRLVHTRNDEPAFLSPAMTLLRTDQDAKVLAYARGDGHDHTEALVILNFSAQPVRVALLPDASQVALTQGSWLARDLLSGAAPTAQHSLRSVRLRPYGALMLQRPRNAPLMHSPSASGSSCG